MILAYCRSENVDGSYHDSVVNMLLHDRDHGNHVANTIAYETGPRLARARCEVVRRFLEDTDAPLLCWFDTDMVPPVDFLERIVPLIDPVERPIVGGLCFAGGRTKIVPTIYVISREEGEALHSETMLSYPSDRLIEVGGTGCACVVIHRSVFEKIAAFMPDDNPLPWYQDVVVEGKDWGEDLIFCLRGRAVGARVWIHTGVRVGHRKKWTIDERAFINYANRLDEAAGGPQQFTEATLPAIEILPELVAVP